MLICIFTDWLNRQKMEKNSKINIKALSVNKCWRGRRFKTDDYVKYEVNLGFMLPKLTIPKSIKLHLSIIVGFSSKSADIDNILKPFIDILQKKYDFNDNRIYGLIVDKEDVKKGKEFIQFEFNEY